MIHPIAIIPKTSRHSKSEKKIPLHERYIYIYIYMCVCVCSSFICKSQIKTSMSFPIFIISAFCMSYFVEISCENNNIILPITTGSGIVIWLIVDIYMYQSRPPTALSYCKGTCPWMWGELRMGIAYFSMAMMGYIYKIYKDYFIQYILLVFLLLYIFPKFIAYCLLFFGWGRGWWRERRPFMFVNNSPSCLSMEDLLYFMELYGEYILYKNSLVRFRGYSTYLHLFRVKIITAMIALFLWSFPGAIICMLYMIDPGADCDTTSIPVGIWISECIFCTQTIMSMSSLINSILTHRSLKRAFMPELLESLDVEEYEGSMEEGSAKDLYRRREIENECKKCKKVNELCRCKENSKSKEELKNRDCINLDTLTYTMEQIESDHTIKEVRLPGCQLTSAHCTVITRALIGHPSLQELDLGCNNIDDRGAMALFRLLLDRISGGGSGSGCVQPGGKLRTLKLDENKLSVSGRMMWRMAQGELIGSEGEEDIDRLDLSWRDLGVDASLCIQELLLLDIEIRRLDISNSRLGDLGLIIISNAINFSTYLKTLNLDGNLIGCKGLHALSATLKLNDTVESLSLSTFIYYIYIYIDNNCIRKKGCFSLADCLRCNHRLGSVALSYNQLDDEGVYQLGITFFENKMLTYLDLGIYIYIYNHRK